MCHSYYKKYFQNKPKPYFIWVFFLAILFLALFGLTESSLAVNVAITPNKLQRIEGVGGPLRNVGYKTYVGTDDPIARFNMNDFPITDVSFDLPMRDFSPARGVYTVQPPGAFSPTWNFAGACFEFMRDELKPRNIKVHARLTNWETPTYLLVPGTTNQVSPVNYAEYAKVIAEFIKYGKDHYGVDVDTVGFNEPEGGTDLSISPTAMRDFIKISGPIFQTYGLKTKWEVYGSVRAYTTYTYYWPVVLTDPVALQYIGALAYHSWWSTYDISNYDPLIFEKMQAYADSYNLPLWCTEMGENGSAFSSAPDIWSKWWYAKGEAPTFHYVFRHAKTTIGFRWDYYNDYNMMNPANLNEKYKIYYIVKMGLSVTPTGADILETESDDPEVMEIASVHDGTDQFALWLFNKSATTVKSVNITGIPAQSLTQKRTSVTEDMAQIGVETVSGGVLNINLPPESLVTLIGPLSGSAPPPPVPNALTATPVSSSQINLSWTASIDNVGVIGYKVYRDGTQIAIISNTNYLDTGLLPSTTYSYTVSAYDAAGNVSAQSGSASATSQGISSNLKVIAKGSYASGWPNMEIWVDGVKVATTTVNSSTYVDYLFSIASNPKKIGMVFTNDYYDSATGDDRNLYIDYIVVNGKTIQAEDSSVILDKGSGSAAFDSIDTIPGQEGILWDAALRFNISDTVPPDAPSGLSVN